MKITNQLHK